MNEIMKASSESSALSKRYIIYPAELEGRARPARDIVIKASTLSPELYRELARGQVVGEEIKRKIQEGGSLNVDAVARALDSIADRIAELRAAHPLNRRYGTYEPVGRAGAKGGVNIFTKDLVVEFETVLTTGHDSSIEEQRIVAREALSMGNSELVRANTAFAGVGVTTTVNTALVRGVAYAGVLYRFSCDSQHIIADLHGAIGFNVFNRWPYSLAELQGFPGGAPITFTANAPVQAQASMIHLVTVPEASGMYTPAIGVAIAEQVAIAPVDPLAYPATPGIAACPYQCVWTNVPSGGSVSITLLSRGYPEAEEIVSYLIDEAVIVRV